MFIADGVCAPVFIHMASGRTFQKPCRPRENMRSIEPSDENMIPSPHVRPRIRAPGIRATSSLPESVEDLAVIPDSEQLVGGGDPVSLCGLRIAEDGVWNPYQPHHVAVQSEYFHCAVESKATIGPGLSKKYINLVFLKESDRTGRQPDE